MTMATVRAAIQGYLAGANIPGVAKVYRGQPMRIDPSVWNLAANGGWGAIVYVHLTESSETRIATPRKTGQKLVPYDVGLVVQFKYAVPAENATALSGDEWTAGLDTVLEGVKAAVRADPNLGTGDQGDVWSAGQNVKDLRTRSELPVVDEDNGEVWVWNVVEANVSEVITA